MDRDSKTYPYNPYDFANPVEDKSLFVGRRDELLQLNYYLDQARTAPRPIHAAILGRRASGKTSLMNMVHASAEAKGYLIVRVNLNDTDTHSTLGFLFRLYDAIVQSAVTAGLYGGASSQIFSTYLALVNAFDSDRCKDPRFSTALSRPVCFRHAKGKYGGPSLGEQL